MSGPVPARSICLAALLALAAASGCKPRPLPSLGAVPAFALTDQHGKALTAGSLRGKPYVAGFMFTRCPDVCPLLTAKLGSVRSRLVADRVFVRYVSFSVDPANDTPEVLARYAAEQHADFADWSFATGDAQAVKDVIIAGFKQSIAEQPAEDGKPANILHGSHFVLVDQAGQIRGYYRSDEDGMFALIRDVRRLVKGEGAS